MFGSLTGWLGEKGTQFSLWVWLPAATYPRVHDLIIPAPGGTTQIDHIIVSIYGLFVIETKNLKGWIYGSERGRTWTQNLYGQKYSFQNPLHQNYRHTRALADFLNIDHDDIHSVVVLFGDCTLKFDAPPNVLTSGWVSYIKSHGRKIFTADRAAEILHRLQHQKQFPATTHALHVETLRQRHSGDDCPKCGSPLVLRTAKKGKNAGNQFHGCSTYPKCRYVRNI